MPERPTLEEIGRIAGMSRSTVSRVINGGVNVSPATKKRVEEVVARTGYRPHLVARSLVSNRTGVIGLVIPSDLETLFSDPYFGRLMLGLTDSANRMDMTLALFLFDHDSKENLIRSKVVNPGLVDGVIITATRIETPLIDHLQEADIPTVVVGRLIDGPAMSSVDVDNEGGARQAALHLARLGRERIGFIGAPAHTSAGIDRHRGFLDGLKEAGLSLEGRVQEGTWTQESGRIAMEKLLGDRPDAVFASSDRMAVGALRAVHDAGLHCPNDVAIVGFDGLISPDQTVPELTTVTQPVFQVGARAAELLNAVIDGTVGVPERIIYPTELVVRQSCGASRLEGS